MSIYTWCGSPKCYATGLSCQCVDLKEPYTPFGQGGGSDSGCYNYVPSKNQTVEPGIYIIGESNGVVKGQVYFGYTSVPIPVKWEGRSWVNLMTDPIVFQDADGNHCEATITTFTGPLMEGPLNACILPLKK